MVELIIFGFIFYSIVYGMIWVIGAIIFYPKLLLIPIVLFLLIYSVTKLITND